jgi:Ca2+-binding EF-hand superfamily protein
VVTTRYLPLLAGLLALACVPAQAARQPREAASDRALKAIDKDADGTIDLDEARGTASALFDRLDPDKDGTLTIKELQGRLSRADFNTADPDNDGTLDKEEYLAVVERRFEAANPDHDGTLDRGELATPAGATLLRVLR